MTVLDDDIDFFSDKWNVVRWKTRPGNARVSHINYLSINNVGLRAVAKVFITNKRWASNIGDMSAAGYLSVIKKLDQLVGNKGVKQLNNLDFENAAGTSSIIVKNRFSHFGNWLRINLGLRINYKPLAGDAAEHGRDGTEEGRQAKLIPIEVMRDFFHLASNETLFTRDRFFINAIVLNAAVGGRINELATLPVDCLINVEGVWVIRLYPEKGGNHTLRVFPQDLFPAVEAAVDYLKSLTSEGRRIARAERENPSIDWYRVWRSREATEYYARKFCYEWTSEHSIYTPQAVWVKTNGQFVDCIGIQQRFGIKEGANFLGITVRHFKKQIQRQEALGEGSYYSWDSNWRLFPVTPDTPNWKTILLRHPHSLSLSRMEQYYRAKFAQNREAIDVVAKVLDEAMLRQLAKIPESFVYDIELEREFQKVMQPVIRDSGNTVLEVEDALMVLPRFFLSSSFKVDLDHYAMISKGSFSHWLAEAGKGLNSVFAKYNIIDPRTGDVAKFKWHDIRHWLHTIYKQGGLTDVQVNALMARKDISQARVYDQTLAIDRNKVVQELMMSIRQDKAIGKVQETYNILIGTDRQTAEEYLKAAVRIVNPMPHGGCTLDLALKTCRHSLSCLSINDQGDCCESLVIDVDDDRQFIELKQIHDDANTIRGHILASGGEGGHQESHYSRVAKSTARLLKSRNKKTR
ncbi:MULTISPECIES: hypothetical protein [unclassified Pseudomonas]|uniref:hypothetical protein n=1 Tax=unclassified Pseudomonas TaxID=196821 RepID=UPI001CBB3120|nr:MULTISPECIES: hypothetical protein [unclassified Pseudomonas]